MLTILSVMHPYSEVKSLYIPYTVQRVTHTAIHYKT